MNQRVLLSIAVLCVSLSVMVGIRKNVYQLRYGTHSDFNIPNDALLELKKQFPHNRDLVIKRTHKLFANYTNPWNAKCLERPFVAFVPTSYLQV